MSNLPGNPFAEGPDNYRGTLHELGKSHLAYEISAALALAYEQRTANLIAVATAVSENGVYQLDPALIGAAQEEIASRLGLGENNE
ncbi:MAG: hypothetical protein ACTH2A_06705 [Glutamicibacter ardleyensis]